MFEFFHVLDHVGGGGVVEVVVGVGDHGVFV